MEENNVAQNSATQQSGDSTNITHKSTIRYKILGLLNILFGLWLLVIPVRVILMSLPYFRGFNYLLQKSDLAVAYAIFIFIVIFGVLNIFIGLMLLLRSATNVSKVPIFGVIGIIVIIVFIWALSSSAILNFSVKPIYDLINKNNISKVIPTITPSPTLQYPTANPDQIGANWKTLSLKKLEFKIPVNWWSESGKNQWYPIEWVDTNPFPLPTPKAAVPIFTLRADTETKSLDEKKKELIITWKLVNIQERSLEKSGIKGIEFWGIADPAQEHYNSRFKKNDKVKIAIFILGSEVYHFLGNINTNEKEFDQILSTFRFAN